MNSLKQLIPRSIKLLLRKVFYSTIDNIYYLFNKQDKLIPPKEMIFYGAPYTFRKTGNEFFQHFINLARLRPDEKVLDLGCGIGRVAIPLTKYLKDGGTYEGFDIVDFGIEWCQKNITPRYPNFHFQFADIYHKVYNPKGKYRASKYKFPYEDETFNFIFLASVASHLLPSELEHYFSEIKQKLKKGGRCFVTFFLLNIKSLQLIGKKLDTLDLKFKYTFGEHRTINKNRPESTIAFNEKFVRGLYKKHGLEIVEPIHYGQWCKRKRYLSYQDIIVAIKK